MTPDSSVRLGAPIEIGRPIRRIAVLRANNVGDFVVATPALRALRAAYPGAEIHLIGARRVGPLAERLPSIDRFLEFPGFPGIRERAIEPGPILRFLAEAQARRYDLALQMHGNGVWSNPFVALLGATVAAGFVRAEDSPEFMGLQRSLVYPKDRPETLRLLDLLASIGVPPRGVEPELSLRPEDEREAERVLAEAGVDAARPIVGMHPGGRFPDRIWRAAGFADVAATLLADGLQVVLTGAGADRPYNVATLEHLGAGRVGVFDLTDRLTLPGLAALICRLELFVSNDTGPAHIAYAVGTPSVTVFGAAPSWEWGSFDRRLHAAVDAPPATEGGDESAAGILPIARIGSHEVLAAVERQLALRGNGSMCRTALTEADARPRVSASGRRSLAAAGDAEAGDATTGAARSGTCQ